MIHLNLTLGQAHDLQHILSEPLMSDNLDGKLRRLRLLVHLLEQMRPEGEDPLWVSDYETAQAELAGWERYSEEKDSKLRRIREETKHKYASIVGGPDHRQTDSLGTP